MNYTELEVWRFSRDLVKLVYLLTKSFPNDEIYGLTNQMRRSAVYVPSNIAGGVGRQSNKETIRFLYSAKGSLNEVETQLYLSVDMGYISEKLTSNKKTIKWFYQLL